MSIEPPSPWVSRFAPLVRPGGSVLDVACGGGRHCRLFRARGHGVTGIDRDIAITRAEGAELIAADLEDGSPWPLPGRVFDAVVVTNDGSRWRAKDGAFLKDGLAMEPRLEHGPGRTRIKLAKLLEEALGVEVHPGVLDPELGGARVNNRGTMRGSGWVALDGGTRSLSSWHTMTECVRKGVLVTRREPDRKDTLYIVTPR